MKKSFFSVILGVLIIAMVSGCSSSQEWKDYAYRGCYSYNGYNICRWIIINDSSCYVKSNFGTNYNSATQDSSHCSLSSTSDGEISGIRLWTDNALKIDYYSFSNGTFTYSSGNGDFHSSIRSFVKDVEK